MRKGKSYTEEQKKELEEIEKGICSIGEYKKYLTVKLREKLGLYSSEISEITGYSESTIRKIHSKYFKEGKSCFKLKKKGGRWRENLTLAEEKGLLSKYESSSALAGTATMSVIKREYELKVGHQVPKSTISRLLKRHGWRKILPRPYHPKKNIEVQETFKKTSNLLSKNIRKHWAKTP